MTMQTERLRLEPWSPAHILTLIEAPDRFRAETGTPAAEGLRNMFVSGDASPEWLASLRASAQPDPWRYGFAVIDPVAGLVVGSGGFVRATDSDVVEIAYGISPSFEGRGYATEVAGALVRFAQADPTVGQVIAHTLAETNASTRVLEKCGFTHTGEIVDPTDGLIWTWELRAVPSLEGK